MRESPELREARLQTVPDTALLLAATILWSQAGGWYVLVLTGQRWALGWIGADAVMQSARVILKIRHHRAHPQQTSQLYQAMTVANVLWFLVMAGGVAALLRIGDPRLLVLGTILSIGFMGYVASRYAAFPRLANGVLYLLGGAATVGLLFSPALWSVAILGPGAPLALQLLLRQNHAILIEARLSGTMRAIDLVCRTGGDEFVVVLPEADRRAAVHVAERLIAAFRAPHDVGGTAMVRVGLSVGIALAPEHGSDIDELLSHADDALYSSKRGPKGVWTLHAADT